jgi:hypothetical protein
MPNDTAHLTWALRKDNGERFEAIYSRTALALTDAWKWHIRSFAAQNVCDTN